jgi:hypothetical protein
MKISNHDSDFYTWTQEQAALLRQGRLSEADIVNLIEEIEDMGISQRRELESRLIVLLMHLLKWQYQADHRSVSWEVTIGRQRLDIQDHLLENPGLQSILSVNFNKAYPKARWEAMGETGLKLSTFPVDCPWEIGQVLDNEFWPG